MGLEAVYERASCASGCTPGDEDTASFADLDADQNGTIDEDEFNQSVFDLLDEYGDEVIGESEFGTHVDVYEDVFL